MRRDRIDEPRRGAEWGAGFGAAGVHLRGYRESARSPRILDQLRQDESRLAALGFHIAMAYSGLGDADEAFRWLERAYEQRGSFMTLLAVAAGSESIRSDPRFADLLRRMGLAANPLARG